MSNLLSLIGWTFLPNLVTGWVQTIYYGVSIRAGDPKPRPGTPKFAEHRRRIHILVVSLYLLYTIYEADHDLHRAGSFYSDLSLPLDASDKDIKSRFRRLAAVHHPDKAGNGQDAGSVNAYFVHLKTASDTLLDPARRFAYERFGPDVVQWASQGKCVTVRDFVVRGGQLLVPYYAVAAAAMYALGLFGYLDWARFERWLVLATMFAFELNTVMRPGRPALFEKVIDPLLRFWGGREAEAAYLPFQIIALARKLCVTVYVAFSQIGPLLGADTSTGQIVVGGKKGGSEEMLLKQNLDRLEGAAEGLDVDTARLLEMEMAPFAGDEQVVQSMKGKMKEWLVQNTIRADPMVRDALGRAFQRRRMDAPSGARGTR